VPVGEGSTGKGSEKRIRMYVSRFRVFFQFGGIASSSVSPLAVDDTRLYGRADGAEVVCNVLSNDPFGRESGGRVKRWEEEEEEGVVRREKRRRQREREKRRREIERVCE
jgi:hypothetical protein